MLGKSDYQTNPRLDMIINKKRMIIKQIQDLT